MNLVCSSGRLFSVMQNSVIWVNTGFWLRVAELCALKPCFMKVLGLKSTELSMFIVIELSISGGHAIFSKAQGPGPRLNLRHYVSNDLMKIVY